MSNFIRSSDVLFSKKQILDIEKALPSLISESKGSLASLDVELIEIDILYEIALKLDLNTIFNLSLADKNLLYKLCENKEFWKKKFIHDWGNMTEKTNYINYKNKYRMMPGLLLLDTPKKVIEECNKYGLECDSEIFWKKWEKMDYFHPEWIFTGNALNNMKTYSRRYDFRRLRRGALRPPLDCYAIEPVLENHEEKAAYGSLLYDFYENERDIPNNNIMFYITHRDNLRSVFFHKETYEKYYQKEFHLEEDAYKISENDLDTIIFKNQCQDNTMGMVFNQSLVLLNQAAHYMPEKDPFLGDVQSTALEHCRAFKGELHLYDVLFDIYNEKGYDKYDERRITIIKPSTFLGITLRDFLETIYNTTKKYEYELSHTQFYGIGLDEKNNYRILLL